MNAHLTYFSRSSAIATQTRWIKEHHITHTVSFDPDEGPGLAPCSAPNRLHISTEDDDSADLLMWLLPACQFIHGVISAGGIVLVHSRMGQSRSSAVVAAYRTSPVLHHHSESLS
jgi:protein-tyrosine phosphatase